MKTCRSLPQGKYLYTIVESLSHSTGHKGSRVLDIPFLYPALEGVRVQHDPRPLFIPGKDQVPPCRSTEAFYRPQGGVRIYLCTFLAMSLEGVRGQHNPRRSLPPGKTRYYLVQAPSLCIGRNGV
jgi:hypothetical protein